MSRAPGTAPAGSFAMASSQGMADLERIEKIIRSGRAEPTEDDKAFVRALITDPARLPPGLRATVKPLAERLLGERL